MLSRLVDALKGGAGSGNFDHAGRPGQVGGSGGSGSVSPTKAFLAVTLPAKKLKFGDTVVFLDSSGTPKMGVLKGPGNSSGYEIALGGGKSVNVPKEHLRIKKGTKRVREFR